MIRPHTTIYNYMSLGNMMNPNVVNTCHFSAFLYMLEADLIARSAPTRPVLYKSQTLDQTLGCTAIYRALI